MANDYHSEAARQLVRLAHSEAELRVVLEEGVGPGRTCANMSWTDRRVWTLDTTKIQTNTMCKHTMCNTSLERSQRQVLT